MIGYLNLGFSNGDTFLYRTPEQGISYCMTLLAKPNPIARIGIIPMMPTQGIMNGSAAIATTVIFWVEVFGDIEDIRTTTLAIMNGILACAFLFLFPISQSFFSMAVIIIETPCIMPLSIFFNPCFGISNTFLFMFLIICDFIFFEFFRMVKPVLPPIFPHIHIYILHYSTIKNNLFMW